MNLKTLTILVTLLGVIWLTPAVAEISTTGLNETQKAELALQAAKMKESAAAVPVKPDDVKEWIQLGEGVGSGIVAIAKELGVAANELLDTKVGLIAIILIVWKVMGSDIIGITFGFGWFGILIPTWIWFYRRDCLIQSIEYYEKGNAHGLRKSINYDKEVNNDKQVMYLIALAIIVIVGCLAIFA